MAERKFDLEDRFVEFADRVVGVVSRLNSLYKECEELIAIAAKSIDTAKKNINKK